MEIEDILDDPETVEEAVEVETVEERPRDDAGRFAPKGVEESASPAPVDKLPQEEYAALKGERERRQAAEARIAALEAQLNPPEPPPSIFEDEQGWQNHFGQQVASQATLNAKLDVSEMLVRDKHPDFDEMKAEFLELAQANPAIVQQAMADPHPWAKAYHIAKNARTMKELGATDLDTLREKLRAEILAEQAVKPSITLPNSLATAQNTRGVAPVQSGPLTIEQIIGA